ncbi:MAG: hypothetical protein GXO11_08675 [Epsilonproteobacteria bacterium]|nr:hypothetical protein [Campylobacterota bacterium]
MKPLNSSSLEEFTKRFEYFRDAEIDSIEIISATSIKVKINVQDSSRGFDWIGLEFFFEMVIDAKLVEESKLRYIDMSEGLSFFFENGEYFCALGDIKSISGTKDALCFIRSKSLKYQEIQTTI